MSDFLNLRHVLVSFYNGTELEGWIRADAEIDDQFDLVEDDTGERLRCNGWNAHVSECGA